MAERLYFYTNGEVVRSQTASFEWFAGFAVSQKQKSIASFHDMIRIRGKKPLEISTKSPVPLGVKMSAFNLKLDGITLECVFQSSKVFEHGGPYTDLLEKSPKDAKRDERLRSSGELTGFRYQGMDWALRPTTAFYDYIYYQAIRQTLSEEELKELIEYDAFTDIEFNDKKSRNTQARSAALVCTVYRMNGKLPEMTPEEFLECHKKIVRG